MLERLKRNHISLVDRLHSTKTSHEKMIEGSAWLTAGSMLSRFLGVLYIIPWVAMMGSSEASSQANGLFAVGYGIYALFLQLSTAGFPAAIAKLVAHYNSLEQYRASWNIFVKSLCLMCFAGVVAALVMYWTAPIVALSSPPEEIEYSIRVIRSLVPAVAIIPAMSLIRGFYQGFNEMAPSAISQLLEQFVRVAYMLVLTFIIMKVLNGHYSSAVTQSTFAAFVGALVSLAYLMYKLWLDIPGLKYLIAQEDESHTFSTRHLLWQMLKESIPLVIVTSGIQLSIFIDQMTFKPISQFVTQMTPLEIEEGFAIFAFNTNKIIMIIISLAVSLATTALPLLASYFSKNNEEEVREIIAKNSALYAFIMFPAAIGLMTVAEPIYNVFYSPDPLGTELLKISCLMSIILGAYTIASAMLQAIQKHIDAIKSLIYGLIIKVVWQPVCIYLFGSAGALWATCLAFVVSTTYIMLKLFEYTHFDIGKVVKDLLVIMAITLAMFVSATASSMGLKSFLSVERKFTAFIIVLLVAIIGGSVYTLISLKFRVADEMLGSRVSKIRQKIHMK